MLEEGDPQSFRVRAYESAAQSITAQASDLGKLTVQELQKIEGVGKSTAEKIRELIETGKVAKLEALRAKHPPAVVALLRIQGLGPKAVKRLRAELGVQSLDDLRRVLAEHKLRDLKGFGQKSEEKLTQSLARLERAGRRRAHADLGGAAARASASWRGSREVPGVTHASTAARCAASPRPSATSTSWSSAQDPSRSWRPWWRCPLVDRVLGRGDSKTSIVTRRGTQIDVRVVAPPAARRGAALLHRLARATTSSCASARSRAAGRSTSTR